mmetsp:Transcript_24372/g.33573  ORF Transcript_24372/g.33573 Transcript_24372/m.33573 type:complete len:83 (+) Transcript_24372:382-630(+)|eukprot:CAMPEP_0196577694 /NCGR_PEP_ID=MMETSP1081-20130531/6715_1 /TAXON_ID=36882 /ORGANISM="Pyramimonas amylifera, Strain CCMP720" /LENGTH=82 /DNA_ID=CAMNT_0041896677 /DNA_START=386 /DNA_END=634 /DNA_ORIENTATION=+
MVKVNVLFFARVREIVGASEINLELGSGANTNDLVNVLVQKYPKLGEIIPKIVLALNQEYVIDTLELKEGDEIALIPPISGG